MQIVMSALPSIADICSAQAHVRFVPIADIVRELRGEHPRTKTPGTLPGALFVLAAHVTPKLRMEE